MEQGTGKTRVAVELIDSTDADFALFFAPFSTKTNLEEELKKWELKTDYEIIAYETISSSDKIYLELLNKIDTYNKLFIVADESIFIKNEETKRFMRIMEFAKRSEYRLILNGTPITKNEWDLYNQMEFLSPLIINMSREEFLHTFFTKVKYKKKFEQPREFYKLSKVNVDYLQRLIEPYIFKVSFEFDKEECIEKCMIMSSVETTEKYYELKEELLRKIAEGESFMNILAKMQYETFTDEERCEKIGKKIKGQTIVYSTYIKEAEIIAKHSNGLLITGDTKHRDVIFDKFRKSNKPLIMTYGVGSYGLNLQYCNQMVFSSLTFDYGKVEQAQARIKRLGQEQDVEYLYYTSNLGIYKMIEKNLTNKETLSELLVLKWKELL